MPLPKFISRRARPARVAAVLGVLVASPIALIALMPHGALAADAAVQLASTGTPSASAPAPGSGLATGLATGRASGGDEDQNPTGLNGETRLSFEVYFTGIHILSSDVRLARDASTYSLKAEAETRGILDVFFDWNGVTETTGRVIDGRAVPARHTSFGTSPRRQRIVEMLYTADGAVDRVTIDPEPDLSEVNPLPENAQDGTIDPLSMITELSDLLSRGATCDADYAVFDGRRRYDLSLRSAGAVTLNQGDSSIFTGDAMKCVVTYEVLGGDRKEKSEYVETTRDRFIYIARPYPEAPAIPVRLEIETGLGTLNAYLTGIDTGTRVLALTEEAETPDPANSPGWNASGSNEPGSDAPWRD